MNTSCIRAWKVSVLCVTVKGTTRSSSEVARGRRLWIALAEVAMAKRSTKGRCLQCVLGSKCELVLCEILKALYLRMYSKSESTVESKASKSSKYIAILGLLVASICRFELHVLTLPSEGFAHRDAQTSKRTKRGEYACHQRLLRRVCVRRSGAVHWLNTCTIYRGVPAHLYLCVNILLYSSRNNSLNQALQGSPLVWTVSTRYTRQESVSRCFSG
jgi:hypothetical protein